jgi:hypothetical protein
MHVAADRPEEIFATAECAVFLRIEHALLDEVRSVMDAIDVLRDPEQRVQIAQAALAILDVGFDQITRLTGTAMTLLALRQLRGDEFGAVPCTTSLSKRVTSSS